MQRNSFSDVRPPAGGGKDPERKMGNEVKSRSVRDIPVMRKPRASATSNPIQAPVREAPSVFTRTSPVPTPPPDAYEIPRPTQSKPTENFGYPPITKQNKKKFGSPKLFIGAAVVVVLAFVVLMMNAFTSAKITIAPKTEAASFNAAVTIASSATSSALVYQTVELSAEKSKEVPANGEEQVERKASAKITIYNNFSSEDQRLIARTRFATPQGLIFRINDSVVIPGKTADKPGSLEVTVFADEAGDKYNVGLTDFTIPGFKDDSLRYKGFYARSVTKAEGGFVGKTKKINEADKAAAKTELETGLKAEIEKNLAAQLDPTLVVLKGGIIYEFSELPTAEETSGDKALIKQGAKAYAIAFKKSDLSNLIESQFLPRWQGLPAEISSYDAMNLVLDNPSWRPGNTPISAKISGSATLVALIDEAAIENRLAGKPKAELLNIINDSPSIISAQAAIRPVWKGEFPDNPAKISVEIARE